MGRNLSFCKDWSGVHDTQSTFPYLLENSNSSYHGCLWTTSRSKSFSEEPSETKKDYSTVSPVLSVQMFFSNQKSKQHVLIYLIFVSPQILFNKGLTQQHKKFHIKDQVWSNQFTFTGLLYNIMKPALKQVEKKNATWMISVQFNSAEPSQTFPRGSFQMEQVETTVFL